MYRYLALLSAATMMVCTVAGAAAAPVTAEPGGTLKVVIALGTGKKSFTELQKYLEANYRVTCSWLEGDKATGPKPVAGIEALEACDVILSCLYRTYAPPEQLERLKKCFRSKPVVGMRRASHGFQNWPEVDREVFGAKYGVHYGGRDLKIFIVDGKKDHPLVKGLTPFMPAGGLYKYTELEPDVEVLMAGGPEGGVMMPQTWLRVVKDRGQRVFYTRYDPDDMKDGGIRNMVVRALFWAAGREAEELKKSQR